MSTARLADGEQMQLAEAARSEGGLEGFHAAMDEEAAAGKRRRT